MVPFVDLQAQYRSIKEEVDRAVGDVLESGQYVLGPQVAAFESDFAGYCQTRYAVGVNSGTSALHLALVAAGVAPGDEVITVAHTYVATAWAISYVGAVPVFVDIDAEFCTMDPGSLAAAITPRTRAIVPVHLYGLCADMGPILEIAGRRGLIVIEDAAQAHGAEYQGRRAGSMGTMGCFSFYPTKNLGAYGEGGAVVTNDPDCADALRALRDHGQRRKHHHECVGFNYRMDALQGAVLRVKLPHLDAWNVARRLHAARYRRLLAEAGVRLLREREDGISSNHLFPVFTPHRDALLDHLHTRGIGTGLHYPIPLHLQPAYRHLGYQAGDLPQSERAAGETLSLPLYAELDAGAVEQVAETVCRFMAEPGFW